MRLLVSFPDCIHIEKYSGNETMRLSWTVIANAERG